MHKLMIFISVLILSAIGHLATDIYLPSMPAMAIYFGCSATLVKLTLSAYMLSFCIIPLIIGPISDRIGRKWPVIIGIYVAITATLLCTFANSIYLLIFSRFLQGLGLGMVVSVSRAILPDHFQGRDLAKYFSYIAMCMPLLLAIGPPLGGFIQESSSWRMVFGSLLFYLILLLILVKWMSKSSFFLIKKESFNNLRFALYIESYKTLLKNRKFMLYASVSILIFIGIASYLTISSFLFQEIVGLSPTEYGFICLAFCGLSAVCGFFNSRLIYMFKPRTILYLVNPLILLSGISLFALNSFNFLNTYTLVFSLMLFFAAIPASFANGGALSLGCIKDNFGAATALISSLQFLGGALSSIFISYLIEHEVVVLGSIFIFISLSCPGTLFYG